MTREEAIERFKNVKANALVQKASGVSEYWQTEIDGTVEAIDMAIEALSALQIDLISRAEAIEAVADRIYDDLCYMYCNNCRYDSEIGEDDPRWSCYDCYRKYNSWGISSAVAKGIAEHALSALPSKGGDAEMRDDTTYRTTPYMQHSPDGADLISRADAIEAVRKELVCDGRHEAHDKTCRFIADVLLSALPSAVCDDCIWHVCNYNKVDWDTPSAEAVHESCEDCPLYDKEKHNCPRFNKVIPRTIADISAEAVQGEGVRCGECKHRYMDGEVTHYYWCRLHDRPVDDADYCAWGTESEDKE